MKAAVVTRPGTVLVREVPDLQPGAGDVLIRVTSAGVCGTDVHIVTGHHTQATLPLVPGHEIAGHVESVGEGVHDLAVGHRLPLEGLPEFSTRDRRAVREDSIKVLIDPGCGG